MAAESKDRSKSGFFISLEGIEGTGKSTQAAMLAERLSDAGFDVLLTREPGGTVIGNRIRDILLLPDHGEMSFVTELLLYNAARSQLLAEKILPALKEGKIVITDRFSDSTFAYQGYGRGIDSALIYALDKIATGGMKPDLTLLFDLDIETGLKRNRKVNKIDRLELEDIAFHRKVLYGFRELAKKEPDRIKIIDASVPVDEVGEVAWRIVSEEMNKRGLL
ncbi:MAG TPA: dTMP kinase [Dissulfurispiraceae bacterium]|nr:dTMP kinase [Dissulfurispiraceae bacterium]